MQRKTSLKSIGWYSLILHGALIVLALQVVALTQRDASRRPIEPIAVGDAVKPIPVRELDGTERTLKLAGRDRDTLLLVFTTTCPACEKNVGSWIEVYERFQHRFDIVGLSIGESDATADYIARHALPYPVVIPEEVQSFARRYRIPAVPQTLRVAPDGTVRESWVGVLDGEQIDSLAPSQAAAVEPAADEGQARFAGRPSASVDRS